MRSTESTGNAQDSADPRVRRAGLATYAVFMTMGIAVASWAARIPQLRTRLGLDPSDLGLVLLAVAAGSFVALPAAGTVIHRVGPRRSLRAMAVLQTSALGAVGIGASYGVATVVAGFFLVGVSSGIWDVAMNVHGADVERRARRSMMLRFHAAFSVGTVVGALIGVGMVALHVPIAAHLLVVACLVSAVAVPAARSFLDHEEDAREPAPMRRIRPLARWTERRTLLTGAVVLAFAFSEGTATDWVGLALIDGRHASAVVGTLGLAWFLAAMTAIRWFGVGLLDRYGRVAVVRTAGAAALAGLCLFVFSPTTPVAFAGLLLWGAGTALGFPVGISAAAEDPRAAAGRVGVVSSIGYWAFLGGPPLIGYLGDRDGVLRALVVGVVPLALAVALAGNLRRRPADAG
jgi:predicted MFS family arabinose efflux permease